MSQQAGDRYRGGYASSSGLPLEKLRVATSTFENYVTGTVGVVFLIFLVFILLSLMTMILMGYARYYRIVWFHEFFSNKIYFFRYLASRRHKPGFYNPPPMVQRYGYKAGSQGKQGTLPRSEYSSATYSTNPMASLPRQLNTASAMSQHSVTATSTML